METDVWLNNYYDIIKKGEIECEVITKHYKRNIIHNNDLNRLYYPIKGDEIEHTSSNCIITDKNNRYKILYLCVELTISSDDDVTKFDENFSPTFSGNYHILNSTNIGSATFHSPIRKKKNKNQKQILYFPIGIFDCEKCRYVYGTINSYISQFHYKNNNTNVEVEFSFSDTIIINDTVLNYDLYGTKIAPYITKVYYSFNSPVEIDFIQVNSEIDVDFYIVSPTGNSSIGKFIGEPKAITVEGQIYDAISDIDYYQLENEEVYYFDELMNVNTINKQDFNYNDIYNENTEPLINAFPLKYIVCVYNNNRKILNRVHLFQDYFKIKYDKKSSQSLIFFKDNKNNTFFAPTGEFLKNSGLISYSVEALDDYLIRNGATEEISKEIKGLNTLFGALKGVAQFASGLASVAGGNSASGITTMISGLVTTAENVVMSEYVELQYESKHKDLSNTPSTVYPNTGENDKLYQDRVTFYICSVSDENPVKKHILNYYKFYGYDITSTSNILENSRIYFDFIKCFKNNISTVICNNNDRVILETIFNRGVTKWHLSINDSFSNNHLLNLNKTNLNNVETDFVFNENYINWLNS